MRFVLRSDRHLADLRAALPRLAGRPALGCAWSPRTSPGAQGGARGRHRGRAHRADPAADAGRRRHPAARPEVVLPDQHRGGRRPLPAGARLGRRRRPRRRVGPLLRRGRLRPARGRARSHGRRRRDLGRGGRERRRGSARMPSARRRRRASWSATPRRPCPAAPDLVVVNPPRRGIGPDLAAWLDASAAAPRSSTPAATSTRSPATWPPCRRCTPSPGGCSTCSRRPRTPR